MGWASIYIQKLQQGETVVFRPRGGSMQGRIESGQRCTVSPIQEAQLDTLKVGDIVLCQVRSAEYLHLIKAIQNKEFLIGNNRGGTNGWIRESAIFGKLIKVEN